MKRSSIWLVRVTAMASIAMLCVVAVAIAQDWEEQVADQIAAIHDEIASDFDYASDMVIGETAAGESTMFSMDVSDGAQYIIVAVCDYECGDVDLAVYDAEEDQAAADLEYDDYPMVAFQGAGEYYVEVIMTDCAADTCAWAAQVFILEE